MKIQAEKAHAGLFAKTKEEKSIFEADRRLKEADIRIRKAVQERKRMEKQAQEEATANELRRVHGNPLQ